MEALGKPVETTRILVAEDDADLRHLVRLHLERQGWNVEEVSNGTDAIEAVRAHRPHLLILDVDMPGRSGYEVLETLRAESSDELPVIFLTAQSASHDVVHGLELGAQDHIAKPFDSSVLVARARTALRAKQDQIDLRKKINELEVVAHTDLLTGLGNRREMVLNLRTALASAMRHGTPLSVMMIDVDHFKSINDRFGHPIGDSVLTSVAHRFAGVLRKQDIGGRWGGEEFLAILPSTDMAGCLMLAERIRAAIALELFTASSVRIRVTVSIGCAEFVGSGYLVAKADEALYEAKTSGRDCVRPHTPFAA